MFVSQVLEPGGGSAVVVREGSEAYKVARAGTVLGLAQSAIASAGTMSAVVAECGLGEVVDLDAFWSESRAILPVSHPDPAHLNIFGTASSGNGHRLVDPGQGTGALGPLPVSCVAAGIAGIYVIGPESAPFRVGFAPGHEFVSVNGAHPKSCVSIGPEIRVGDLPGSISGTVRIWRGKSIVQEIERHLDAAELMQEVARIERLTYAGFPVWVPGDVHVHFYAGIKVSGTGELSPGPDDTVESAFPVLGLPLRNKISTTTDPKSIQVEVL